MILVEFSNLTFDLGADIERVSNVEFIPLGTIGVAWLDEAKDVATVAPYPPQLRSRQASQLSRASFFSSGLP